MLNLALPALFDISQSLAKYSENSISQSIDGIS